ncbi:MAG TPA: MraY family glycosyltransferase [bacterium]|nr:MraY family glycosyltransferase [bacterium]HOG42670.1 MraY family glycosyltransferase [bacterium]HPM45644.1 MraY family glycosyltransferase [bacterium]HPV20396.1 MraY family glycosyltransferase [bacterium]HQM83429.1 MraY family glycosyltransferase [bacterium]
MRTYLTSFIVSFLFVLVTTPFLIKIGIKHGFVDKVDQRKIHQGVIPRIGGIGIAMGTLFPLFLLYFYNNFVSQTLFGSIENVVVIIFGGLSISILGLFDDIKGLPAKFKFLFQIALAVIAIYCGFSINAMSTPWGVVQLGWVGHFITVLWIVGIINAFNLIDGMDGLSSGVSFFACITIMSLSIVNGYMFVALVSAALAGAVVGFLVYNFNPAKIFMGDAGSMFIGYVLAVLSLKNQSKGHTIVSMLVPIIAMGLPILDTTLAFLRRFLRNQSIFSADKQHIHHILLSKGLNQRKVVFMLYGISVVFTALAMLLIFQKDVEAFLVIVVFSIVVFVIVSKLGYTEMFYSRFKTRKEDRLENHLENYLVEKITIQNYNEMFDVLPISGFEILDCEGKRIALGGTSGGVHFFDIAAEKNKIVRLYWVSSVPTINNREAAMLLVLAKSIVKNSFFSIQENDIK